MIARVWTARATAAHAAEYRAHFERHVLPALRAIDGYMGATLQTGAGADGVEIVATTRWRSMDAIRAFAGDDLERAVVAAEARALLSTCDERVRHYEIVVEDG